MCGEYLKIKKKKIENASFLCAMRKDTREKGKVKELYRQLKLHIKIERKQDLTKAWLV